MAVRKPLVLVSGGVRELPAADSLAIPPNNITQAGAVTGDTLVWNGTAWAPAANRETLSAVRTYYVRTDGNNSNTGLANSSGGAFLTVQRAVDVASALDTNGFVITINIVAGTYTSATVLKPFIGGGSIVIRGLVANLSSVILSVTGADTINANGTTGYELQYMRLQTTTAGACINGGSIKFSNIAFGNCAGNHIVAGADSFIKASGPYTLNGTATSHLIADLGQVDITGVTVTITGSPALSFFAVARYCGVISAAGCAFSGSMTGQRYFVDANGVIFTNGAGPTFFPGSASGTTSNGGQYV